MQTHQDSTSGSSDRVSSVLPSSSGHDEFFDSFYWRFTSGVHSTHAPPCSINQDATKLTLPCEMYMTLETLFISILKKAVTVKMRADVPMNLCTN